MPYDVFISHASESRPLGMHVSALVEHHGFACWIAPRDIRVGEPYAAEIIRGINECPIFLILLDERANVSANVARELERAVSKDKRIVGLKMDDLGTDQALEFFLGGIQVIDAFGDNLPA